MDTILELLKGDFVVLDLGSSSAVSNSFFNKISKAITLLEIDAIEPDLNVDQQKFNKRIILKTAVSDTKGKHDFYRRKYFPCSSFLQVDDSIVKSYGMEEVYKTEDVLELDCTTVSSLLAQEGISRIDFFKTDLEGLDFNIIKDTESIIKYSLALQCESRFQPIYSGEANFFDVCKYMDAIGFEVVHLKPEYWKYNTANNKYWRDGRLVWGDFIFFLKEENLKNIFATALPATMLKQILIAKTLDLNSHAEYLYEKWKGNFNIKMQTEIEALITPVKNLKYYALSFFSFVSTTTIFSLLRKYTGKLYAALYVDKQSKWAVK